MTKITIEHPPTDTTVPRLVTALEDRGYEKFQDYTNYYPTEIRIIIMIKK